MRRKDNLVPRVEDTVLDPAIQRIKEVVFWMPIEQQKVYKPEGIPLYTLNPLDFKMKETMTFYRRVFKAVKVENHRKSNNERYQRIEQEMERERQEEKKQFKRELQKIRKLEMKLRKMCANNTELFRQRKRKYQEMVLRRRKVNKIMTHFRIKKRSQALPSEKPLPDKEDIVNQLYSPSMKLFEEPARMTPQQWAQIVSECIRAPQRFETDFEDINDHENEELTDAMEICNHLSSSMDVGTGAEISDEFLADMSSNIETDLGRYSEFVIFGEGNDLSGPENECEPTLEVESTNTNNPEQMKEVLKNKIQASPETGDREVVAYMVPNSEGEINADTTFFVYEDHEPVTVTVDLNTEESMDLSEQ